MITLDNVTVGYGKKAVVRDVTFTVKKGQAAVLVGENGSGKSTLMAAVAGALPLQGGSVRLGGRVAYIPQGSGLMEELTFADNLRFFAALAGAQLPKTLPMGADALLKTRVRDMSGGMKKLCSIVCALVSKPDILLLDEPCAALDAAHKKLLCEQLCALKAQGVTLLYIGHEEGEYAPFADLLLTVDETVRVL